MTSFFAGDQDQHEIQHDETAPPDPHETKHLEGSSSEEADHPLGWIFGGSKESKSKSRERQAPTENDNENQQVQGHEDVDDDNQWTHEDPDRETYAYDDNRPHEDEHDHNIVHVDEHGNEIHYDEHGNELPPQHVGGFLAHHVSGAYDFLGGYFGGAEEGEGEEHREQESADAEEPAPESREAEGNHRAGHAVSGAELRRNTAGRQADSFLGGVDEDP